MRRPFLLFFFLVLSYSGFSQTFSIEGKVRYKNYSHYRFRDSCYLELSRNDTVLSYDTVGYDSYYHFFNLPPGTYKINVSCNKIWVGGAATDALIMLRHYVGMYPPLTGLNLLAGDPSGNHVVSAVDALYTERRFVQAISSFPTPDYIFDDPIVNVTNANILLNINGLCKGDVNGSGIPLNTVPDWP